MKLLLLSVAIALSFALFANANFISFGNLDIDRLDLAGSQTDGLFTYEVTSGNGWELITQFGNPPAALTTFFNDQGPQVGDTVEFFLTDGGIFTFDAVDFRTVLGSDSDDVQFFGFLNGELTDTLLLDFSATNFFTIQSGFTQPIDRLTFVVAETGGNAAIIDNLSLTKIPEPSSAIIGLTGLAGLMGRRRR